MKMEPDMIRFLLVCGIAIAAVPMPVSAQKSAPIPVPARLYADLADLATTAPITVQLRIRKATKITGAAAVGVLVTQQRYLVVADVTALIRSAVALPPRVKYLFDAPRDSAGKLPKLAKSDVLAFATIVANRPTELQLIAPDAQIAAAPADVARVRAILAEDSRADAPPRVTGVGNAFHVAGTLEGEGETQIFLTTADGRPISFTAIRSPGIVASWSVSSGELVDSQSANPARDTLLWYRLACFLPRMLPRGSVEGLSAEDAQIVAVDYRTVVSGLGNCPRARPRRP